MFLEIIGEKWDQAKYCLEGDISGYSVIFLLKVILKNPSNMWDTIAIDKIKSLEMWDHPFVEIRDNIPATHNLVFIVIEVDNPRIRDIGEVFPEK